MDKQSSTLRQLVKLDYDAIEAYDEAIKRIKDPVSKANLADFRNDHALHTENLGAVLRNMGEDVPEGPDLKRVLIEGKVRIADLGGDRAILHAMIANEKVTSEAYDEALKLDELDAAARQTLESNREDERRHKQWIEKRVEELKATG